MLSERTIINALILVAGLIVGPYLTLETFHGDYWPVLIAGGLAFTLPCFFILGNKMCAMPMFGLCFGGMLNFLPLRLTAAEFCTVLLVVYYLITYVALRQRVLKVGPIDLWFPIAVVGAIVFYHVHAFGIRSFGGNTEGSRPGYMILIAIVAYLCGVNIPSPSISFLRNLPWICFALTATSSIPFIITTVAPGLAPAVYNISDNVNLSAYSGEEITRWGGQAGVGATLQVVLLAFYPIHTWWRPERWWVALLSFFCFWLVLHGAFRNVTALYLLTILLGAWCYISWRALVFLPALLMALLILGAAQSNNIIELPLAMQRSLSFLPGDWDPVIAESDVSSNEFRMRIQRIYLAEDVAKSPFLGNGFAIDQDEFADVSAKAQSVQSLDGYYGAKVYIVGRIFHTGWISVYDAVGAVGTVAFIMLGFNISRLTGRNIFGRKADRRSPLLPLRVWIFTNVTRDMIGFFTVFGSFDSAFPTLCAYCIILGQISTIEHKPEQQVIRLPRRDPFDVPKTDATVSPTPYLPTG